MYAHCVELLIGSPTQFDFSFYDFSVIYYDFSKLLRGMICIVLESSGGKKSIFIGWRGEVVSTISKEYRESLGDALDLICSRN
jgi:hypothetical protein